MNHEYDQKRKHSPSAATNHNDAVGPGQSSRSALLRRPEQPLASGLVQRKAGAGGDEAEVHAAAARGVATTTSRLPHADVIQRAFGRHDISAVQAHVGPEAAASARKMGAAAYATGNHVILGKGTDLHTVAHEAAHVIQQRGGVQLKGGVGEVGDAYERHADAVGDCVVSGASAERLLDEVAPAGKGSSQPGGVQMAGHAGVIIFGKIDGEGTVLKRVEQTEYEEYRSVMTKQEKRDQEAIATFPKVYAVYDKLPDTVQGEYDSAKLEAFKAKHDDASRYVEMASVKENPEDIVKDFKLGTSTTNAGELVRHGHVPDAAAARKKVKRENNADALTETKEFGLRDSDQMRTLKALGVFIGKKFDTKARFLSVKTLSSIQKQVQKKPYSDEARVFEDLLTIENYIKKSDTVYLASSLVMNWSDNHEKDSLKLIDLAHPLEKDDEGFGEAKDGMLHGIQNLWRILKGEALSSVRPDAE